MVLATLRARAALRTPIQHALPARRSARPQNCKSNQSRFASSSSPSSSSPAQQKAKEALEGAQKGLAQAAEVAKKLGGNAGEKAGQMLGSYREPLAYNLSVGRELLKQVYITERLQPPTSWSTISHVYSTLWSRASNPAYWREVARSGEWQKIGIYALEAYGIFKIGEIVGRRSLVGYNLQ